MTKDKELIESLEKQVKELKEQLAKVEGDNAPARSKVFNSNYINYRTNINLFDDLNELSRSKNYRQKSRIRIRTRG
jgi:hypothetical protein